MRLKYVNKDRFDFQYEEPDIVQEIMNASDEDNAIQKFISEELMAIPASGEFQIEVNKCLELIRFLMKSGYKKLALKMLIENMKTDLKVFEQRIADAVEEEDETELNKNLDKYPIHQELIRSAIMLYRSL
ncbi:hypothetical protein [Reichenbachiella sp.]|uniref:hypothetical protein n=1 Tax=Reichenbachiella sp. TaxID=2184521 RepID=UPI003BB107D8